MNAGIVDMAGNRIVDRESHYPAETKCAMADKLVGRNTAAALIADVAFLIAPQSGRKRIVQVEVDYSYFAQT
jgi:hypothetical protein